MQEQELILVVEWMMDGQWLVVGNGEKEHREEENGKEGRAMGNSGAHPPASLTCIYTPSTNFLNLLEESRDIDYDFMN